MCQRGYQGYLVSGTTYMVARSLKLSLISLFQNSPTVRSRPFPCRLRRQVNRDPSAPLRRVNSTFRRFLRRTAFLPCKKPTLADHCKGNALGWIMTTSRLWLCSVRLLLHCFNGACKDILSGRASSISLCTFVCPKKSTLSHVHLHLSLLAFVICKSTVKQLCTSN